MGSTFAGRVAASLLRAVGLDDLIADSLEQYEALALKAAADPAWRCALKARLARNRDGAPAVRYRALRPQYRSGLHIHVADAPAL